MDPPSAPSRREALLWRGLLLTASFLTFWSPSTATYQIIDIPVELVPPNGAEGKGVLLFAQKLPEIFSRLDWFREDSGSAKNIVTLISNPRKITNGPAHSGRETLFSNGSLLIQNLTVEDTRTYGIQVITVNNDTMLGKTELRVYKLLPKPKIIANNLNPKEKDSVVLMCETERLGTIYQWLINTQPVQLSTRLQLSPDKRTLTVRYVTRKDTGPYECETSNPVSVNRSNPFILTIFYGPDKPNISPSKDNYLRGENLNLTCLTDSKPPAQFEWFMDDKKLADTQTLSTSNLSLNDIGLYTCLVSNHVTGHIKANSIYITFLERILWPRRTGVSDKEESPGPRPSGHPQPVTHRASSPTLYLSLQYHNNKGCWPSGLTCLMNDTGVSTQWYLNIRIYSFQRREAVCGQQDPHCPGAANPGLSSGAIAVIVIGVLFGAALIAALVYFLYVRYARGSGPL